MVEQPTVATILNVNDDEANRYMVGRMLQMAGYRVIEAGTGLEALQKAQTKPDVIILDIKLPDLSGYEVCARLRANPDTASIAVLHTSATFVTPDKKAKGLDGGADAYLTQPFEATELVATVRSLIRLRHAEREMRRKAEELAEADKRKDEFLAMLAHELRNPLAAITTAVGILDRRPAPDEKEARMRGIIQRQARHLSRLVDDLLDVSRITQGKVELRRERCDLRALLEHALTTERPLMEARGLTLEVDLPQRPLWMEADCTRLEQVFVNLLDNAAKYTDGGGCVKVSVAVERVAADALAVVRVKDSGIGIPPEALARVFDLFAQVDTTLERSRGGLGIGLTLVRSLVQMHGGRVSALSEGLGYGSEFVVRLPLLPAVEAALPMAASAGTRTEPRRILVVEDNPDARASLRELLELWGHSVETAPDGLQGLSAAVSSRPDVALVDIGLPGLDGYRLASELRARAGQDIRLVAITGYGGPEGHNRALAAGFDVHLVKPVQPDELARTLAALPVAPAKDSSAA
ncbi:response regulator [Aggregicoccus sp. 17bor-14]|uniref:response regulator n=1 Tax=Myxococcaceae TaxID=31 RepID=UPI0012F2455B|nr:response regulator [Simulacricoccus sp. 17bor-14]MRI91004.1 response regulator [Aggregicoccus sp. 17bor-14]